MRHFVVPILILLTIATFSCKDKVICPAFQSTYILNDSIRMAKFSLFGADSVPKYQVASRRNKYGINKNYGLFERQRKNYDLMTSPKENVLGPPAKDSLFILDEGEFIASDFTSDTDSLGIDSLQTDSLAVLPEFLASAQEAEPSGPKYKYRYNPKFAYNHEQEYYNKYFGKLFIDNRPAPEKEQEIELELAETEAEVDSLGVKKKKKFVPGFLKKKKRQSEEEEPKTGLEEEVPDEELEEEGGN